MKIISDFHIHSRYSRATSKDMNIPELARWAKFKGISLLGSGDFTHPGWIQELKTYLKQVSEYTYEYDGVRFILTGEVSNIFYRNGKNYRVHNIIFMPSFDSVEQLNKKLQNYGELVSDGRPLLSLDCISLVEIVYSVTDKALIIPAHAWTPHFSIFGSLSGFDSIEECFGKYTNLIKSIETGLSSDPKMNWRLSKLDNITLVSNSDAHSPQNLGREANVFEISDNCQDMYTEVMEIIKTKDVRKFLYTIEFYPEEGKYHYDGHRNCKVCWSPKETKQNKGICPICGKKVTIGVLNRVDQLADRDENIVPDSVIQYRNVIPLMEIIADALGSGKGTQKTLNEYLYIVTQVAPEFEILLDLSEEELRRKINPRIAEGVIKVRKDEVDIFPGYDGEYGKINIRWTSTGSSYESYKVGKQLELF
ncbi:MAG: endonuclease Q family protein [Endomicrobia bacterium]|nr:endonuclease Q family protein [Endomicrobiia bacterium]MDW8055570.1 endonuclease Q family protein [Elusimicrobiota bacterium]